MADLAREETTLRSNPFLKSSFAFFIAVPKVSFSIHR
nr:MAG TPA: hypothetical protein [Caudoviricetes sp.]